MKFELLLLLPFIFTFTFAHSLNAYYVYFREAACFFFSSFSFISF